MDRPPSVSPTRDADPVRYRAFISYSHADKPWGLWVHRAIEAYRPPRAIHEGRGRIRPVFRDDAETAASADLSETIARALRSSDALVVVCSPNSARSRWVDREIRDFKKLGGSDRIFSLIVDGLPHHPERECFPPSLKYRALPDGSLGEDPVEPLAVDVRVFGRRDALLKLVAGLLGVGYDALKRRDRARRVRRGAAAATAVATLLVGYSAVLVVQTRAVNAQASSILSAVARVATDEAAHDRALRLAVLSARSGPLSPVALEAEPSLARAAHASTLEAALDSHRYAVYSAAWDETGRRLVTGSQDHSVRVWRFVAPRGWTPEGPPIITDVEVMDARFAEGGGAVAVRPLEGGPVGLWRATGGEWKGPEHFAGATTIRAFDMTARGDAAALGLEEGAVAIWRLRDGHWSLEAQVTTARNEIPEAVALSPDGGTLAGGLFDGTVSVWKRDAKGAWGEAQSFPKLQDTIEQLAFAPSGNRLLSVGISDVRILDRRPGGWELTGQISGDPYVTAAAFQPPDGRLVATNSGGACATLWSDANGIWVETTKLGTGADHSRIVSFDPAGRRLVTAGNDAVVRIWTPGETTSWQSFAKITRGIGSIRDVGTWTEHHTEFAEPRIESPDGRRVVAGDVYGIARVRDTASDLEVAALDASPSPTYRLRWGDGADTLEVLPLDGEAPIATVSTRFAVGLSGEALIGAVCTEKLNGSIAVLTTADVGRAPILRGREGENVCKPPPLWRRSWQSIRMLFDRPAARRAHTTPGPTELGG